jgi:hypothetical protein
MDFDPCLDKLHPAVLDRTLKNLSVRNCHNCFFSLLFYVDVRPLVLPSIEEIQGYNDTVEHGDDRHGVGIPEFPFFSILFAHV